MLARPKEMVYKDIKKVPEHEGWTLDRTRGSHLIYIKGYGTETLPITLPIHKGIVKGHYIKEIAKVLELEEKYGEK